MKPGADFTIRPATAADMAAIKAWIRRARLDRTGLDWRHFKVAERSGGCPPSDDSLMGFCQVRRYRGVQELGSLYVRRAWRGQGVGAALIRTCLAGTSPPVYLECAVDRQPYYERFGFRRIPTRTAPTPLAVKSLLGDAVVRLLLRKRIIVMCWDG